jgi:hypothetical protein
MDLVCDGYFSDTTMREAKKYFPLVHDSTIHASKLSISITLELKPLSGNNAPNNRRHFVQSRDNNTK